MVWNGEDLYRKHAEGVYRYLFALCREADTAEELTQETFYQALKGLNSFRGECAPQTWLCAIAKRLWYRELSRRGRTTRPWRPRRRTTGCCSTGRSRSWTRKPGR